MSLLRFKGRGERGEREGLQCDKERGRVAKREWGGMKGEVVKVM